MGIIYYITRALLKFIAWVFFREITIDGDTNIPTDGGVIFVGNHQNQFMVRTLVLVISFSSIPLFHIQDALLMMLFSPRTMGFLIAKKSLAVPVVGT
jgi:1-acyl-sn-glycerol-3-phosphate acyltransferase